MGLPENQAVKARQDCRFWGQRYREQWCDTPDDSDYWALVNRPAGPNDTTTTKD